MPLETFIQKIHAWNVNRSSQVKLFRSGIKSNDPEVLQWLRDNAQDYLPGYMVDNFLKKVEEKLH